MRDTNFAIRNSGEPRHPREGFTAVSSRGRYSVRDPVKLGQGSEWEETAKEMSVGGSKIFGLACNSLWAASSTAFWSVPTKRIHGSPEMRGLPTILKGAGLLCFMFGVVHRWAM